LTRPLNAQQNLFAIVDGQTTGPRRSPLGDAFAGCLVTKHDAQHRTVATDMTCDRAQKNQVKTGSKNINEQRRFTSCSLRFKLGAGDENRTRVRSLGSSIPIIFLRRELSDQNKISSD
jgi:hypothetical protein